jgi:hypothetical protein
MNERILELYKQAHVPDTAIDPSNNMHYQTTTFSAEKFAELIVKECARVQHKRFCEHGDVSWDILMEHFGVK